MIRYFALTLVAHLRGARALFLLTTAGVALGVASVLAIQIINRNALAAFEGSMRAVSGEADLTVLPRAPALREEIFPRIAAVGGVAAAWPLYRVDVSVVGRPRTFLEVVGADLFAPLRVPWRERPDDLGRALFEPGWVAISPSLAEDNGWTVGSSFEASSGSRRVRLTVGALVDFQKLTPLASRRLVVMDIAQAQGLLGTPGEIHQVDVRAAEGVAPKELQARLARALGAAVEVLTPEQRRAQAADLLGAFRLNLTALSLISLFVGGFLVFGSTQASLVRRRAELGLLRSLGATRGQVLAIILAEVVLVGLLGVAIGIPLGCAAAAARVEVVSATLSNLYLLEEIEKLEVPGWIGLLGAALGIAGAVSGALLPALDASRRETRSLLAPFDLHERIGKAAPALFVAGVALALAGGAIHLASGSRWKPSGFVLAVGILVAVPLLAPLLLRETCRRIRVRDFGVRYAIKSLGLKLQTTAVAVGALAVAVSMLVGITLMVGSFRRTLEIWIGGTVRADVYVSTDSWGRGRGDATIDPVLEREVASWPGVRAADRLRQVSVQVGGRRISLAGVDAGLPGSGRFELLEGDPDEAIRAVRERGAALVGEPLARRESLGAGDLLRVPGPDGEVAFPVAGVYYDYGNESGSAIVDLATFARVFGPGPIQNLALYLEPGLDPERVVAALQERFADVPVRFRSNARLRSEIFAIFDQTFAITRLLQGMALVIAAAGITLSLLVLAREAVAELALYRSLGALRGQIFRVYLGKGIGMAAFGLVLGSLGGVALAMVLIFVINRSYFGWTIALHWPWGALARQAATILVAAAAASLYPASRASRTPASELSRDDL